MRYIIITFCFLFACSKSKNDENITKTASITKDSIPKLEKKVEKIINPDAPKGIFVKNPPKDIILAEITTNIGKMSFELYPNRTPFATENFINLAKKGFYNGNIFFRVIPYFVAQTGDKTNTGYGDAGYSFKTETHPDLSHDGPGLLSFANFDQESNSSQFFITLSSQPQLDERHPIFGMIIRGKEVLDKINELEIGENDRPKKLFKIEHVKIIGY